MKKHSVPKQQGLARPYNVYNIFFILERALFSQAYCVQQNPHGETPAHQLTSSVDFCGYDGLCLPDFPPRYIGLLLPLDWYVPGKNAKRKHVATNGMQNFTTLARTVAQNWRVVDDITLSYCKSVAQIIKERHVELVNHVRSEPSHLEQLQQKEKQESISVTTTPLVGADANASYGQRHQSFIAHDVKTSMTITTASSASMPSSLNQLEAVGTRITRSHSIHDMERASATVTPLSKIFDEVATHVNYEHDDYLDASNDRHLNRLTLMSAQHQNPTEEYTVRNVYDMFPPDWEDLNNAPDIDDVNITDHEVHEMWGLY